MADVLKNRSPQEVAAFYSRLADAVDRQRGTLQVSLAALLMRRWLTARRNKFSPPAPPHLTTHSRVVEALKYHRRVYLTQEKARLTGGAGRWAGVVPRLQGKPPYTKWDMKQPLQMDYQSLVEMPLRYQITGTDADRDILYALHGFQLRTVVVVEGAMLGSTGAAAGKVRIRLESFEAQVIDRYDWDYNEHLTVPNPDFGSQKPGAIEPDSKTVVVYHSNAKRLEDAGLAAPYDLETALWSVTTPDLVAPADVDPTRQL